MICYSPAGQVRGRNCARDLDGRGRYSDRGHSFSQHELTQASE